MVTNCTCNKSRNPPATGKITGRLSNGIMRINIPVDSKSVEEYHTHFDFPEVGVEGVLYVAKDEDAVYRYESTNNSYQVVARGDAVNLEELQKALTDYLKTDDMVEISADEVEKICI